MFSGLNTKWICLNFLDEEAKQIYKQRNDEILKDN